MARVATDVGGTFTDSVLFAGTGQFEFQKSPSAPTDFSKGILDCLARHDFDLADLESMIHGSTVVINAKPKELTIYENEFHPCGGVAPEAFGKVADWLAEQLGGKPGGVA